VQKAGTLFPFQKKNSTSRLGTLSTQHPTTGSKLRCTVINSDISADAASVHIETEDMNPSRKAVLVVSLPSFAALLLLQSCFAAVHDPLSYMILVCSRICDIDH
jgi:hypothetical protein